MQKLYPENPYQLLEEARKSWDYFISNEIVYEGKFINTHRMVVPPIWVDSYRESDIWFEVCIHISDKLGIALLIEYCDNTRVIRSQGNLCTNVAWCNDPMFVGIRQKFQVSEEVKFRPIPSVVWLKSFNFTMCRRPDVFNYTLSPVAPLRLVKAQRESDTSLLGGRKFRTRLLDIQHGKFPSNMVKRSPKVSDNISDNQSPVFSSKRRSYVYSNQLSTLKHALRYGLFPNGILWVEQAFDTPFESVDVYIRPLNLQPGTIEWLHMLYYPFRKGGTELPRPDINSGLEEASSGKIFICMDYQQALEYLNSYTDYERIGMPHDPALYDLRRVYELMDVLGNPHLKAKSVHITGTNGKGSTAAMIASVLSASGYTTGLYTSPHLHTWRERMQVNGKMISEDEFASLITRVKPVVEEVNNRATYGKLTTFELLTSLAFAYFRDKKADFQVLEVGMGGRFDATSIITPEVSVLTSISFDHTGVLGNTLTLITGEKAAIIKPDGVAVISPQADEVEKVIRDTCDKQQARLIRVGTDVIWEGLGFDFNGQHLKVTGRLGSYELFIPLLGEFQQENAAVAVAALEVLAEKGFNITADSIIEGLAEVRWLGRLHIVSQKPFIVVDGGHNPGAVQRFITSINQYFEYEQAILVTGISSDKDIAGVVSIQASCFDKVIVTRANHPRATAPERLRDEFAKHGKKAIVAEDMPSALSMAITMAGEADIICVSGSLFIVAEAIKYVETQVTR